MKFFAIYTTVKIINKPDWLDDFRSKFDLEYNPETGHYDDPYEMHITLAQPRFISDNDAQMLKTKLEELFNNNNNIGNLDVDFSDWHLDRQDETNNGCIMIKSPEYAKLSNLQQQLLEIIGNNHNYLEPKYEKYEKNFIPHLTIGRDLSRERYDSAISMLPKSVLIKAEVDNIVLAIVKDKSTAERNNPNNLNVYRP